MVGPEERRKSFKNKRPGIGIAWKAILRSKRSIDVKSVFNYIFMNKINIKGLRAVGLFTCLLYTSPSPRDS